MGIPTLYTKGFSIRFVYGVGMDILNPGFRVSGFGFRVGGEGTYLLPHMYDLFLNIYIFFFYILATRKAFSMSSTLKPARRV